MHFSIYYYSTVFAVSAYAYTPAPVALRPGSWSVTWLLYLVTKTDLRIGSALMGIGLQWHSN